MFKNLISILLLTLIIGCGAKKQVVAVTQPKPISKNVKIVPKITDKVVVVSQSNDVKKPSVSNDSQVLEATSKVKVTNAMVLAYIAKYKEIAKSNMVQFGIPASITLAQALLESGSGVGSLCLQANNHFGIKCRADWTGPSVKYDDDALQECFRKYADPKDSFKDHSTFLLSKSWYSKLFKLDIKDYKSWAKGLKAAGYATDPMYPQKLINLIEKNKLYEIDNEVKPHELSMEVKDLQKIEVEKDTVSEKEVVETQESNSQNYYTVQPKDTMYSLSKKFNISVDELKLINNLTLNGLSIGQNIKIKK